MVSLGLSRFFFFELQHFIVFVSFTLSVFYKNCLKIMTISKLGWKERVPFYRFQSIVQGSPNNNAERKTGGKSLRRSSKWLCLPVFLHHTRPQHGCGLAHSDVSPPKSAINQEKTPQAYTQDNLKGHFLSGNALFQNNSSFHTADTKLARTFFL